MDYSSQAQHDKLVEEIKTYWISNGWRLETLMNKSTRELLGIRNSIVKRSMTANKPKAQANKKPIAKTNEKQLSLFGEVEAYDR